MADEALKIDREQAAVDAALALLEDGCNCAQAVAGAFTREAGVDDDLAFRMMEGFGGGMGQHSETCGAISGGVAIVGMATSDGFSVRTSKLATYEVAGRIVEDFAQKNGSTICREIKGETGGEVLRSCPGCVEDATRLTFAALEKLQK